MIADEESIIAPQVTPQLDLVLRRAQIVDACKLCSW